MKRIVFLLILVFSISIFSQENIKKIDWKDNIEKGIKIGKKQKKEILIYFGKDKCVPCRMIDKYAFTQKEFIDYSNKYIMVKVYDDLDKSNLKNQEYVKKTKTEYGIESVPTIVLLKDDGTKSSFFAYVKNPQELIKQIEALY
mgnify:CR=1 FL=1